MFWDRFYELCLAAGSKPNPICKQIGIASGTIAQWKQGTIPSGETLLKLAERLDCSIDYLLGRADNPNSHKAAVSIGNLSNVSNQGVIGQNNGEITVNKNASYGEQETALLSFFEKLDAVGKAKLIITASDMAKQAE